MKADFNSSDSNGGMRSSQERVEEFVKENNLEGKTSFKILDLAAEVGEVAADAAKSADYGQEEEELDVKRDEIGDVLFSLLALASDLGIDAEKALDSAISKYSSRIDESGDPGSR